MRTATPPPVVLETHIPGCRLWRRGKVRDVYDLKDRLLLVATDRISAFDVVFPTGIPDKGRVLTQLSLFWFRLLSDTVAHHILTDNPHEYGPEFAPYVGQLAGRSILVQKTEVLPFEAIVRGYLAGSGWKEYQKTGSVCGIALPTGLKESDRLDPPIFTPSTKAEAAHDENIPFAEVERSLGARLAARVRDTSLELYARARAYAETKGILVADTKFEFGLAGSSLLWVDEALTPDSSRFWPKDAYAPGRPQPSFDKQYVRDYLESQHWNKRPPAPTLPEGVVARTREKYREAYRRITGLELP